MSLENFKSKIKKVGKPRETEGSPAKSLARACEKANADVPEREKIRQPRCQK